MPVRRCLVSFTDATGLRHEAEVEAETIFEAAVLAVKAFKSGGFCEAPSQTHRLCIQALVPVVRHELTLLQVYKWMESAGTNPGEQVRKRKLKDLLDGR